VVGMVIQFTVPSDDGEVPPMLEVWIARTIEVSNLVGFGGEKRKLLLAKRMLFPSRTKSYVTRSVLF